MGARKRTLTPDEFREATGHPLEDFRHNCHAASHAIVQAGIFPTARVARGSTIGVPGQHSWVVLHDDPYSREAFILDPTRWSYRDRKPTVETLRNLLEHRPHGAGHFTQGRPPIRGNGATIGLAVRVREDARLFLDTIGPLDAQGWARLANLPVEGWPSREIISAMLDTPALRALVPIDIAGMLTDRNPGGLYLSEAAEVAS